MRNEEHEVMIEPVPEGHVDDNDHVEQDEENDEEENEEENEEQVGVGTRAETRALIEYSYIRVLPN